MKAKKILAVLMLCIVACTFVLGGCGSDASSDVQTSANNETTEDTSNTEAHIKTGQATEGVIEIEGLTYEGSEDLAYAEAFSIDYYEGGYGMVKVTNGTNYLIVPEDGQTPANLPEGTVVLQKPLDRIYLAATASMALFTSMDATGNVRMCSLDESGWTFDEPVQAMKAGELTYAGKYSAPDYEMLIAEDCDIAIESTMIAHTPEVKEMIEELGVPVFIDYSSYEKNPLGRMEWIKLYGFMTDHQDQANKFFEEQVDSIKGLEGMESSGKTVAYFYFSSDGKVVCRSSEDYIPAMIRMAGGEYIFKDLIDEQKRSNISISVEQFYETAANADYIVYNGSIDSSVKSLSDLLAKDEIMKNFKAVKEDRCYCSGGSVYQRTDLAAGMILEFNKILNEENPTDLTFMEKLK